MEAKTLYDNAAKMDTSSRRDESQTIGLKTFHNDIKKMLYSEFARNAPRLLDVACGRGGDLHKYKHSGIPYVKGIDISNGSIEEAKNRLHKMTRCATRVEFECCETFGTHDFKDPLGFDAVSCMFALHYFFESEPMLRQMLKNVSSNLKSGSVFFGCVPHALRVLQCLNLQDSYTSSCLKISRKPEEPTCFGSAYEFAILDTVTNECSREFLVFQNVLTTIAAEYGLMPILVYNDAWKKVVDLDDPGVFKHFKPEFISLDEMEASAIFAVFAFRKQ